MHDVVIVGAGPVGLFLAGELALAGCSVLVLEREAEPHSPWRVMPLGMRGLSAGSVEAFYRRGMLESLMPEASFAPDAAAPPPRAVGHFAGMMLDPGVIDAGALRYRLPSPALEGMMTSLDAVETVLAERAVKLGVQIRRGITVTGVEQAGDGVLARAGEQVFPARWLVGCDGGRSAVRRLAGFDFAGTQAQFTGYIAHVDIDDLEKLRPGFNLTPEGMYLRMFVPGHIGIMDFDGGAYDRTQPPGAEHLQEVLRRVSGTDVTVTGVRLASSFTDRAKQASAYRRGRVLLAGDAAHIHSPLGGQGLNLGIGDAMNLGWKLASVVRGSAAEGLLDSYTAERHPVGARVLDWSRAQVAVMRPDPYAPALQALVRDLLGTGEGTTYVYERLNGTSLRYDLGDDRPLVGRNAPDLRLADGTALGDLLREGLGVVLDFSGDRALHAAAGRWPSRIRYVAGPARDDLGLRAVLVRPDGFVAWIAENDSDRAAFEKSAGRWFGSPER
ncbi:FAD-dependent oxidoreductase [Actinoplanes ianthinogenes]|uniref:FAD-dependent oxidoreductase n=1 Tax=Actinoplanes ianthinogenes TaxID=122358 RepID=A0ABM7M9X2_9ACTN|nr:FAD-dependent oxidoreductase [Actinoplanes ianthinogenes]BCJ48432.1 FAD-dependent oxidoreductase [Actinoplanes ianthinogenes]GGR46424.1 FAD-dependent oxidoreductase [Actinoplanes ianthinogenes]